MEYVELFIILIDESSIVQCTDKYTSLLRKRHSRIRSKVPSLSIPCTDLVSLRGLLSLVKRKETSRNYNYFIHLVRCKKKERRLKTCPIQSWYFSYENDHLCLPCVVMTSDGIDKSVLYVTVIKQGLVYRDYLLFIISYLTRNRSLDRFYFYNWRTTLVVFDFE